MEIAVLVKGVPDFREGKVVFKEDNTLNRNATPTVLNPNDKIALEAARELQVKHGGTIHVLSMGPPNYDVVLREAMGIAGDRLYLLSDRKMAGADTWATAAALSAGIRKIGSIDLVIAGFKTADGETGQTGPQTALLLHFPIVTHTTRLALNGKGFRAERLVEDEVEVCEGPLPAFLVTDPAFSASYTRASDRLMLLDHVERQHAKAARFKEQFKMWDAAALDVPEDRVGLPGSPTIVRKVEPIPRAPSSRTAKVLDGTKDADIEELARLLLAKLGA